MQYRINLFLFFTLGLLSAQNTPTKVADFKFPDGKQLSTLGKPKIILVYGDSHCPACQQAQSGLKLVYEKWEAAGFALVYIALDEDKTELINGFGTPPWRMYCDEMGWESPWVKALKVYATPTLFALNEKLEVLYEAENVGQMNFWVWSHKDVP